MELFGLNLALRDFPRVKSLRGIGTSDANLYAVQLSEKFDYRNTFYNRQPKFDITAAPEEEFGKYDFVLASEVFEHVLPPAEAAFRNVHRLLKPTGILVFTVPYSFESSMAEHYPDLYQYGFAQLGGETVLVNRTRSGSIQVFEKPVFHCGWAERALEMREFTERALQVMLVAAGFSEIRIYCEDCPEFGIVRSESCSVPIAARKGPFAFSKDAARDVIGEWQDLKLKFNAEMRRLDRAFWFRVGRKLGLV